MQHKPKVVAFLPVKETSERIKNKNTYIFDGDPLFIRKLKQLIACPEIDEVYLDTESHKIRNIAAYLGVKCLHRPQALASNQTDGHSLFAWECAQVEDADIYLQALCTAPFVDEDTIGRAIRDLLQNVDNDSLVAVSTRKDYSWTLNAPNYGFGPIPNSVDLPNSILEAMSLYMVRKPASGKIEKRFGKNPILFKLNVTEDVDINNVQDLELAECIAAGKRAKAFNELRFLSEFISTPTISDCAKDLGLDVSLPPEIKLVSGRKSIGTAKTMSLRAINANDEDGAWLGIYDALDLYDFVRQGDIIAVGTDVPQKAFFGNLNGSLALRAGAVGALIDGTTRDIAALAELGFPAFARRSYYEDIKYHGTLKAIGEPIVIGDRVIQSGDLIFGDENGVVAVPQKYWAELKLKAIESATKELQVRSAVLNNIPARDILKNVGEF
jgi:CMP-N-acetylneuraminic acid synthetase/regulator of RNase E activity RraA